MYIVNDNVKLILNLKLRFEQTGSVGYRTKKPIKQVNHEEYQVLMVAAVVQDLHLNTRKLSDELKISYLFNESMQKQMSLPTMFS